MRVSDDLDRLKKLFRALLDSVARTKGELEIILLAYAEGSVWQGLANIHNIQEWRDTAALVPMDWR